MKKSIRYQLIAFCVIAAAGVAYVGINYVRLPTLLGFGQYTVNLELPDSGGIFSNASVSYRGTEVGRVGDLSLTNEGVNVELKLDNDAPKIPANARAVVANRSAIGEQYVDLRPVSDTEPYLEGGDTLTGNREDLPVRVEELVEDVDNLTRSIPIDPLRITVEELGDAVRDRGPELRNLADSLIELSETGIETLPQLKRLIQDGAVVLDTQAVQQAEIVSFSGDLRTVTEALRDSDSDLRRLIDTSGEAATEASQLVRQSGPALTVATERLSTTMKAVDPRASGIRVLLQLLPVLSSGSQTVAPGDGTIHFGLVLENNNPPPCTIGYERTEEMLDEMKAADPSFDYQEQDFPVNWDASCDRPANSMTAVRGSDSALLADPNVAQPWDDKPKVAPDRLDLSAAGQQLAEFTQAVPKGSG